MQFRLIVIMSALFALKLLPSRAMNEVDRLTRSSGKWFPRIPSMLKKDPSKYPPLKELLYYSKEFEDKSLNDRVKNMARNFRELGAPIYRVPSNLSRGWRQDHRKVLSSCHSSGIAALNQDSVEDGERIWVLMMVEIIEAWENLNPNDSNLHRPSQANNTRRVSLELKAAKGESRSPYHFRKDDCFD